ncbi:MAG: hypothetical protein RLZZ385_826 [Pseudomonadota bacterium]|jgi:CheY-like chemotaxis protein
MNAAAYKILRTATSRVLIIGDTRGNIGHLADVLRACGCDVTRAASLPALDELALHEFTSVYLALDSKDPRWMPVLDALSNHDYGGEIYLLTHASADRVRPQLDAIAARGLFTTVIFVRNQYPRSVAELFQSLLEWLGQTLRWYVTRLSQTLEP